MLKPRSFSQNRVGETSNVLWVAACIHHSAIQTKIEVHFGGFFHHMKVRQPRARQDSMQTVIQTSRRLESFLHEAAQNFEVSCKCEK
jgi:hypothetical protein